MGTLSPILSKMKIRSLAIPGSIYSGSSHAYNMSEGDCKQNLSFF